MLQLFLGISAFSALIVAAISRQHQLAMLTLRQSVAALQEREQELTQLVDMVPSHVWRLTPEGEPTFFNKRMVDFIGRDVPDIDRRGVSRLAALIETAVHPDDARAFGDALGNSLATGERFSMRYRLRRVDGVYHWMSSRAEPLRDREGRIVQWYGLCHDIDDQVHAEQSLRERERELSLLVDMVPSYLWRLTLNGEPNFYNKRLVEFLGLDVEDVETKPEMSRLTAVIETIAHPDDAAGLIDALNRCLATGERFSMKYRLRRADGVYRWVDGRAEPLRDQDGSIVQWYGLSHDIDDQFRAEAALRDREQELSLLVDMIP